MVTAGLVVGAGLLLVSCGSSKGNSDGQGGNQGNGGETGSGGTGGSSAASSLVLTPQAPSVSVDPTGPRPTTTFRVSISDKPVDAEWKVDRPDLAEIDDQGVFQPTGKGAGAVTVTATVDGVDVSTVVAITVTAEQNGPDASTPDSSTPPGPGGFMGVGGEGVGIKVNDTLKQTLASSPTLDSKLKFLYPYDQTVWPLGMLPPLLMWESTGAEQTDGVYLKLTAKGFEYKGYFGRPTNLGAKAAFVRHPIPLDAWQKATLSAAGGTLDVELVVSRGGVAYGPVKRTWTIADGLLQGCVYYQSYFTKLVANEHGAMGPDPRFGGATLGIKPGATDPVLVAGFTSDDKSGCRVCHSVSSDGSRMVVQRGDNYSGSSSIDLRNGYKDTQYPASTDGQLGWVGMTPDGKLGLSNSLPMVGGASEGPTALHNMATGAVIPTSGLTSFATHVGLPAFSHDGKLVAFNFYEGPGNATIEAGDGKKLVMMSFNRDSSAFSDPRLLYEGEYAPMWPSFMPNASGVVFELELRNGDGDHAFGNTRGGGLGELWWADVATGKATRLDALNGLRGKAVYIPTRATYPYEGADESRLNYEPTVSPIASGGYAWVVFMSRRLYGNEITAQPWASDPRETDLTKDYSPKKLWVAAVKLDAKPGEDPSFPAFYLPAQEIQASNSRGYWTADPCVYVGQM